MEAKKINVASLFQGYNLYKVPFYQRSYVWGEDKWSRFLDDMYYVSSTRKSYFLGSIILKQENTQMGSADERTIIDGQQRLTTILIFFKTLCLKNPEFRPFFNIQFFTQQTKKISLQHSMNDIKDFTEIINKSEDEAITKSNPSKLIQVYNFFQRNLDATKIDYHALMNNLTLIGIDLNQEDDEQLIFDTINSLSEPLTTGELLKNYFFKEESKEEYEVLWRPVFEEDNETIAFWNDITTQGRIGKTNIDAFLNAMLQIKIHNRSIPNMTAEFRARIKRNDRLFHNYKELISTFHLDKKDFIYELIDYATLYKENFSQDIDSISLPVMPCIERINFIIKNFDSSTLIPYILYVLKNVSDENERNRIYDYLEAYITRRIIAKSSNNNFSDLFSENLIGGNILTYEALREYIESKGQNQTLAMPSDLLISRAVREYEQNNKRSLSVLYLLETRLRANGHHSTTVFPFEAYSLEHIMPKKWQKHWNLLPEFDESMREHYIKTLGNHTILNSRLNTSISNSGWQDKLQGNSKNKGLKEYATGLVTIKDFLDLPEWDENEILNRADWLVQRINEVWLSFIEGTSTSTGRRPPLNFLEMGLKVGDKLVYVDDPTKVATVVNGRKISFEGETETSLTAVTTKLRNSKVQIQPTPWWTYNGKNLSEIYNETYSSIQEEVDEELDDSSIDTNSNDNHIIISKIETSIEQKIIKLKRSAFRSEDGKAGYIYCESKAYHQGQRSKYWYGYRKNALENIETFEEQYIIYAFRDTKEALIIPVAFIEEQLKYLNTSIGEGGEIKHWHIVFLRDLTGNVTQLLSKPTLREINMNKFKL